MESVKCLCKILYLHKITQEIQLKTCSTNFDNIEKRMSPVMVARPALKTAIS